MAIANHYTFYYHLFFYKREKIIFIVYAFLKNYIIEKRKYDPSQESYIRPWGYMFYRVLLTEQDFLENSDAIYSLINTSYDTANNDDILKVKKENHNILAPIFSNTYEIIINQYFF